MPHTIRVWEQRYNALQPGRSDGNTRYYDGSQLRRLLNIVTLNNRGYKISEICRMSDEKLFELIEREQKLADSDRPADYYINQMASSALTYDEPWFEKVFSHCVSRFGMKKTYGEILYPLLERIGLLWSCNKLPPAQEHFITALIRQKLSTAIDALPPATINESWMLFLPEDEFHELGLLFAHYVIREKGRKSTYVGANLPLDSAIINPDHILLFMIRRRDQAEQKEFLATLKRILTKTTINVAARPELADELNDVKGVNWLRSSRSLEEILS
jgi:MerR family transcriptional regulator, light-induced transcriptional regulator